MRPKQSILRRVSWRALKKLEKLRITLHGALFVPAARTVTCMKGYPGEACGECQNFTLVQNGTCKKCDTCGATTGCS
jgi:7-cyano-7-deazaguanine synthase in queuosine biosynthesis